MKQCLFRKKNIYKKIAKKSEKKILTKKQYIEKKNLKNIL